MNKASTTEEFIEKARRIYGDLYDYFLVDYLNNYTKIKIICKIHGIYLKSPDNHLRGQGCKDCVVFKHPSNTQEFIEKATKIHGNKYNYLKVNYKNNKTKIEIFCNQCKLFFWQTPNKHLNGRGCNNCGGSKKLTAETFIEKARKFHGNRYGYPEIIYENARTKIKILCYKHTSFWQTPDAHLRGQGCPKCTQKASKPETQWLNELKIPIEYRQYKIEIENRWFLVDGYNPITRTIYEFLGDYFHGNPRKFKPEDLNKKIGKTFGELYSKAMEKIKILQKAGYNVVYIWENNPKRTDIICL